MNRAHFAAAALLALGASGCPSGYEFRAVPGQVRVNARDVVAGLARDARKGCDTGLRPYVHCESEPLLCRADPLTQKAVPEATCRGMTPLLSLAHLSDAQLKEDQVAMDGPLGPAGYDRINEGSRRDPDLERYDFAVLLATVLGINSINASGGSHAPSAYAPCPAPLPPSFVVHTGDAMDAGMFSELYEFLTIMLELEVPFFNVVGNHDNLFFGTFPKEVMKGLDVTLPFVPVGDTDRFLLGHHPDATLVDFSIPYRPAVDHEPTVRPRACEAPGPGKAPEPCWSSNYFGFDLVCPVPRVLSSARERAEEKLRQKRVASPSFPRRALGLCPDARGYYGQDFRLPDAPSGRKRKVRFLVLNTAEIVPRDLVDALDRKSQGNMRDDQYLWLTRELSGHRQDDTVFLVAGHHNLRGFVDHQKGWLRDILVREKRVAAYLTGHTHVNAFHSVPRTGGQPLLEVIAGSTLIYPQLGNLVDLLEGSPGELYVRVRSFRQRVGDAWCGSECSLKYLAANGRTGAYNDKNDGDWRQEDVAKQNANGLFRVSGFQ